MTDYKKKYQNIEAKINDAYAYYKDLSRSSADLRVIAKLELLEELKNNLNYSYKE